MTILLSLPINCANPTHEYLLQQMGLCFTKDFTLHIPEFLQEAPGRQSNLSHTFTLKKSCTANKSLTRSDDTATLLNWSLGGLPTVQAGQGFLPYTR